MRSQKPRPLNRVSQIQGFRVCCQPGSHVWCLPNSFLFMSQPNSVSTGEKTPIKCTYVKLWMARETSYPPRYTMEIKSLKILLTPQLQALVFPSTMWGFGHHCNSLICFQAGLDCVILKNCFENTVWKKNKICVWLLFNDYSISWPEVLLFSEPFPNYIMISKVSSGDWDGWPMTPSQSLWNHTSLGCCWLCQHAVACPVGPR